MALLVSPAGTAPTIRAGIAANVKPTPTPKIAMATKAVHSCSPPSRAKKRVATAMAVQPIGIVARVPSRPCTAASAQLERRPRREDEDRDGHAGDRPRRAPAPVRALLEAHEQRDEPDGGEPGAHGVDPRLLRGAAGARDHEQRDDERAPARDRAEPE